MHGDERGFTLIEMLVALAIFSLAALALVRLDSMTIRSSRHVEDQLIARLTANALAADILTDPTPPPLGSATDVMANGGRNWRWTRTVEPMDGLLRIDLAVMTSDGQVMATQTLVRRAR